MVGGGIVGRGAELAVLGGLVEGAARGRGAVVAVIGEAGIGKSRLLAEVSARAAGAGLVVLAGRAVAGGGTYRALASALVGRLREVDLTGDAGLRPYRAALGRMLPDFGPPARVEAAVDQTVVVGEAVVRLLRALGAGRGVVLVLDDLHWADADTLAVVEYLIDAVTDQPILVCVAARDTAGPAEALQRIGRQPAAVVLRPARLDAAEVAALARDRSGGPLDEETLATLVRRSDGLPLLVEELTEGLRQGSELDGGVPSSLRVLVAERMDALAPEHRRLLEVAAVVGVELGWPVVGSVAEVGEAALLAGLRAANEVHLLRAEAGELTWRHTLTQDAVVAALLPTERAAIARRAAELLDTGGTSETDARAAELYAAAGDGDRAGRVLLRLARHDLARGALRSAESLLGRVPASAPVPLAIERVRLATMAGDLDAAIAAGEEVVDQASGDEHAELCLALARAAVVSSRWTTATGYVDRAGRPNDPRSALLRAEAAYATGDPARALELAGVAARAARIAGNGECLAGAELVRGRSLRHADAAAAAEAFGRAVQVAAEHGLTPLRAAGLFGLSLLESLDRPDPPALAAARELAESAGLLAQLAQAEWLTADLTLAAHGPVVGEPIARRGVELARGLRWENQLALAETQLAIARAQVGDLDGAQRWLARFESRPDVPPDMRAGVALVRAIALTVAGDLDGAAARADEGARAMVGFESAGAWHAWGLGLLLATVTTEAGGSPDAWRRLVTAGDRRLVNRGALAYADAVHAGRRGDAEGSGLALARGDAALAGHPWWHRLLRMLVCRAMVVEGWGDPVPSLRADLAWHEQQGNEALAARCRDLLRALGALPRRTKGPPVPPHLRALGVTGREAEVLHLVVQGLTNAQVAARLHLSVRTVDSHVARLLTKTGAPDRTHLAHHAEP